MSTITAHDVRSIPSGFTSIAIDYATGAVYERPAYDPSTTTVYTYGSVADLETGALSGSFSLGDPGSIAGTYMVALGGHLYGRYAAPSGGDPTGTTVGTWSAATGILEGESAPVPDISGENGTASFDWGGYSAVNLLQDGTGRYVLGRIDDWTWQLAQLDGTNSSSVVRTFSAGSIGFAFMLGGIAYLGDSYASNHISQAFDFRADELRDVDFTLSSDTLSSGTVYISDTVYDAAHDTVYLDNYGTLVAIANASVQFGAPQDYPTATSTPGAQAANAGTVTFAVHFSQDVLSVDTADFATVLGGTAQGTVSTVSGFGQEYVVTVTGVGGTGSLALALSSGVTVHDAYGHALSTSGLTGTVHAVDRDPPGASSVPDLATASDSGWSQTDAITKVKTPTFTGTAEPGATVVLYDTNGTTALGSTVADATTGEWSVTSAALSDGHHVVTARATDAAGNAGPASGGFALRVDTAAPTLQITSDAASLKIGEIAQITFTFSEDPGQSFSWDGTGGDVTVSGGTLSAVSGSGLTRTATFTPASGQDNGLASIAVAAGAYEDAAGNAGRPASAGVAFDTRAPGAPAAPVLAHDTGRSASDRITSDATLVYAAPAGTDTLLYSTDGTHYGASAPTFSAEGAHSVYTKVRDAAGNIGPASSLTFTLDRTAPTATVTSNVSRLIAGASAQITFTFSEDPGATFTAASLVVAGGTLSAISGSGLTRSAVFTPTPDLDGGAASIAVRGGAYSDLAGNPGTAATTPSLSFDTRAPTATLTASDPTTFDPGTVHFAVVTSEAVTGLDTADFRIVASGLAGAAVTGITRTDASHYSVAVATGSGDGSLTLRLVAAGSGIADSAGNLMAADAAGAAYAVVHNHAPVLAADAITPPAHTFATGTVLGNDLDPDGHAIAVTSVRFAGGLAVAVPASGTARVESDDGVLTIGADGHFSFLAAHPGQDSFIYTASDGHGGSASAALTITTSLHAPDSIATFNFAFAASTVAYVHGEAILTAPDGTAYDLTGIGTLRFTDGTIVEKDGSPLVDDLFFYAKYRDVWQAHIDARQVDADGHYAQSGWREGRDPNPLFSTAAYLAANPDVAAAGVNPLQHFDQYGWREGRDPGMGFGTRAYLAANPDVAAAGIDPFAHYLAYGALEGRQAYPGTAVHGVTGDFDASFYLAHNPDVAAARMDPLLHFLNYGWKEGRDPDAYFSTSAYLAANPDVAASHADPLLHYETLGWREGRDPSSRFSTNGYLAANPDVAAAHVDPLQHYLQYGHAEGRHGWEL